MKIIVTDIKGNMHLIKQTKTPRRNVKHFLISVRQLSTTNVSKGPYYICTSCSQVFFKHSVVKISRSKFSERLLNICTSGAVSVEGNEYICNQCNDYLKKGNIPPLSCGNGLSFPAIPPELNGLTQLEERFISPRIPFMQIRELPRGGQLGLKGNVINVPSDVNLTVKASHICIKKTD